MTERPSKTLRKISKQRQREFVPGQEPNKSYTRQFRKTRMSWPIALIYMKRKDVLAFVIIILTILAIGGIYMLYQFFLWLINIL